MHIGILNCLKAEDEEALEENETIRHGRFLGQATDGFTFTTYKVTHGELPAAPHECDAYLITGSAQGVYDDEPWIAELQHFIRACYEAQQKMVGICFGHQVLAHALGGRTEKSAKGWGLGLREFEITGQRPWMTPTLTNHKAALYFAHQDQVVGLPPNADRLAGSDFCPNAMFVIGEQVLGIQGHPEYSRIFAELVADLLRPQVDEATVKEALHSLDRGAADGETVAHWVANFLQTQTQNK